MRIIYCLNSLDILGGIERVTINKANALAEMGHDVTIVVTDHKEDATFVQPLSEKVKFVDLKVGHWFGQYKWHSPISKRFTYYRRLKEFVSEYNPDVIISVGQSEKQVISLLRTKAVKIREIHFLSTYRKYTYNKKWLAKILDFIDYKLIIRGYDQIVLLTNEDYHEQWIGDKKKTSVIWNPLTITPKLSNQQNKIVTCVCRLNNMQKNINELVDAFAIVAKKHPDWVLKIYGKGPDEDKIRVHINKLNLDKHILLEGYSDNVPKAMSEASIFAFTSNFEGFGLCIVEALASGLPVVTYQFPVGAKDILEGSDAGFLVPMHDIEMLAEKICYLIENEDMRKEMSLYAIKRAQDFEISNIMNQWINLFNKHIEQKNR